MSNLAALREMVAPTSLRGERTFEVARSLKEVLPGGIATGSVISVGGTGATSLLWTLLAHPTSTGRWAAMVGVDSPGWTAAAEAGVDLDHVVVVAAPTASRWPTVIAALIDGFELVVVQPRLAVKAGPARRIASRLRERGSALVVVDRLDPTVAMRPTTRHRPAPHHPTWPEPADVVLSATDRTWRGIGSGHGHLRGSTLTVVSSGRRRSARPQVSVVDTAVVESAGPLLAS